MTKTRGAESKGPTPGHSVNLPELLARLDDDRELLRDLVSIFKVDFPGHLQALREAVARKDMKQTMVVNHTLKGMLSNLAVTKAAAAAAQLEQLGRLPEMETYMAEVES